MSDCKFRPYIIPYIVKKGIIRKLLIFAFLLICAGIVIYFSPFRNYLPFIGPRYTYTEYLAELKTIRSNLEQASVPQQRALLRKAIANQLFKYWNGTHWGFNGTTEVPGKGKIACGYFVTTVLRDCGVQLDRSRLAQQSSESMIQALVNEKSIQRFSRIPLRNVLSTVRKAGDEVYIIGLDTHVGFLVCEAGKVWFIHSSGSYPWSVVKEEASKSIVLEKSVYRVIGCLTTDTHFMANWDKKRGISKM